VARADAGPGAATQAAFAAWHDASPQHAAAWAQVSAAHEQAAALAEEGPLLALRQQTLARTMLASPPARRPGDDRRHGTGAGGHAAGRLHHPCMERRTSRPHIESFHTDVGQQADVTLPDGSLVTLDTNSRLEVRFAAGDAPCVWKVRAGSIKPLPRHGGSRRVARPSPPRKATTTCAPIRASCAPMPRTGCSTLARTTAALAPGRLLAQRGNDRVIRDLPDPAGFTGWREGCCSSRMCRSARR
jgi:transmembrane sensor